METEQFEGECGPQTEAEGHGTVYESRCRERINRTLLKGLKRVISMERNANHNTPNSILIDQSTSPH